MAIKSESGMRIARLSIYWVSFLLLGINALSPAMATLTAAMPDRGPVEIQMIEQIPYMMTIPTLLTTGIIARWVPRKVLMVIGMACYLVGGLTCFFTSEYWVIFACRCILGAGIGILNPCTDGLIADYYYDSPEYPKMIGLNYMFKSLGGIFYTLTAGWLATIEWHYVFLVYSIGIPAIFFLVFVIPDAPMHAESDENKLIRKVDGHWRLHVPRVVLPILLLAFLGSVAVSTTNTNVSYLIVHGGYGTAALAGIAAATFTLGNVVGSGTYSRMSGKLGERAYLYGQICVAIGLFSCAFSFNLPMIFFGVFFIGLGNGIMDPALMMRVGRLGIGDATLYFALFMAAMNLGSTVQGMLVPTVALGLGGDGYGALNYGVGGTIMLLAIVLSLVLHRIITAESQRTGVKALEEAHARGEKEDLKFD